MLVLAAGAYGMDRPQPAKPEKEVAVTLVGRADNLGSEIVNIDLPLPPGFLRDASLVRIYGTRGTDIEATVRSIEPWRTDGKEAASRSIQIQFQADFRRAKTQQVKVVFGKARGTGEERALETGKIMAKLILNKWDPVYNRAMFHYWTLTGDERIPTMVTRWCDKSSGLV